MRCLRKLREQLSLWRGNYKADEINRRPLWAVSGIFYAKQILRHKKQCKGDFALFFIDSANSILKINSSLNWILYANKKNHRCNI